MNYEYRKRARIESYDFTLCCYDLKNKRVSVNIDKLSTNEGSFIGICNLSITVKISNIIT